MKKFGLIGKTLKHSFSKKFFTEKFEIEKIDAQYDLYELEKIEDFISLRNNPDLVGLNVTIPYKEQIFDFLDEIDPVAQAVGAVNTIKFIHKDGKTILKGYNTDIIGFRESFVPLLKQHHKKALILGSGGASKAVLYVMNELGIESKFVSRNKKIGQFTYEDLNDSILGDYNIIINCTPVGMYPNIEDQPSLPYQHLTQQNYIYDLIYNPPMTRLCKYGADLGATVKNGQEMLELQAKAAWEIWNELV